VEGSLEYVLCHEADCMPRILCFFPMAIGSIFGFVFTLNRSLSGSAAVMASFAAIGFLAVFLGLLYCAAGLPIFRRRGCASGCRELLAAAAAAPAQCCRRTVKLRGHVSEPETAVVVAESAPALPAESAFHVVVSAAAGTDHIVLAQLPATVAAAAVKTEPVQFPAAAAAQ